MKNINPIRVLIVDDHAVVRKGLSAFLNAFDDLELVGESSNGEDALRQCKELKPNVVLMDLVMPGMDGVTATSAIRKSCPDSQVIILTSYNEEERVQSALNAGAIGYLLKDVLADQLVSAIRNANSGVLSLTSNLAKTLLHPSKVSLVSAHNLTNSEKEVLVLMVEGLSNPDIAKRLSISISTVRFHVSNVLSKLGVLSRTAAVTVAIQNKLVT
jgi:two-component system, NarL family, response regulator LiaR